MKLFISCCMLLGMYGKLQAQSAATKPVFSSVSNVGLVVGNQSNAFAMQSKNGIQYKQWFGGIGAGFDFYNKRTIPLFLTLQRELSAKAKKPFVYADGGLNFRWSETTKGGINNAKYTPGLYYECGVGYKIQFHNNTGLLVSAGYSFKQVKEKTTNYWYAPTETLTEDAYESYDYKYRRIVVRLGLQL